jgi:flavin-dependent dehydrogenase
MLLARKGYRVLLVDRAKFPSDAPRNHFIQPAGVVQLKRWGLLERIAASNCPPITKWTVDVGSVILVGCPTPLDEVRESYGPRRTVLDKILVDAAVEAGAELRENFSVQELLREGECVTGIRGRRGGGASLTEKARIVIGADGLHSLVARAVQAATYNERPALTCTYFTYWSGLPLDGFELYVRDDLVIFVFPTNDHRILINVGWSHAKFHEIRADIEGNYLKALEVAPGLAERVRISKREEPFAGTADMPNFFRKPFGKGWALVGDAGYHKDYFTAQGITDAFRDAGLLAEAIDAGLSGHRPLEEALADYERQRNDTVRPMYELTCQRAALGPPPPDMQHLFAALQGNQTETNRFFGTTAGTVPIPEFFSPENIGRIISGDNPVTALPEQAN